MSTYSITFCTHKQHWSAAKQHKHSLPPLFRWNKRAAQSRLSYHMGCCLRETRQASTCLRCKHSTQSEMMKACARRDSSRSAYIPGGVEEEVGPSVPPSLTSLFPNLSRWFFFCVWINVTQTINWTRPDVPLQHIQSCQWECRSGSGRSAGVVM